MTIKRRHIALGIACGLAGVAWLITRDIQHLSFSGVHLGVRTVVGLLLALMLFAGQNLCLMLRYRHLTHHELSWKQAFRVNALCEFTSAATPGAVGGSSLIFLFLNHEGFNGGRSTAVMMSTLIMDELFIALGCITVVLAVPTDVLFGNAELVNSGVRLVFFLVLTGIAAWTAILYTALFHKPHWVGNVLLRLFSLPLLRRWKPSIEEVAHDIITSSQELRRRPFGFWLKAFAITAGAWCCRYAIVNAVLFAFTTGGGQILAFMRQFVLWLVATVTPTPGGSGLSEYMFNVYYSDFTPDAGTTIIAVIVWRLITYYTYLIAGACVVPGWIASLRKSK